MTLSHLIVKKKKNILLFADNASIIILEIFFSNLIFELQLDRPLGIQFTIYFIDTYNNSMELYS
jgi:hypothetical protein